jgi:transcriptional regulator with XRE-family HTH domain
MSDRPHRTPSTVAARLNELFATVTWVDDRGRTREYSTPQVARAITDDAAHDTSVSRVYLATLRSGVNANPTVAVLKAIAKFFDERRPPGSRPVTASFLLGEGDPAGDDPEARELRDKLADRQVRMIAMRAGDMSPAVRRQVLQMLDILGQATDSAGPPEPGPPPDVVPAPETIPPPETVPPETVPPPGPATRPGPANPAGPA